MKPKTLIFHLLLMSTLLWACTPKEIPTVPEPENPELRLADFDGTINKSTIGDIPVFFGVGTLDNDIGQVLSITVTGPTSSSVEEYFNTAKFYFEIREPVDIPIVGEPAEKEPDLSVEEIMKDEEAGNLWVEFRLSEETSKEYPKGALLVIVDPTVVQNRYNNYASIDPASNIASVTIRVSQGQVLGRLYRMCILRSSGNASPGLLRTLSNSGVGRFDLTIRGVNAGNNVYRVTGLWNYDYGQDLPDSLNESVTC
jgi:hypothetical protein